MQSNNKQQVLESLHLILSILETNNITYRFLGSVITCALRSEVYRDIKDLDLLIDRSKQEIMEKELEKNGYTKKVKNHLRVSEILNLQIYQHSRYLETSFYGIAFLESGDATLKMPNVEATIECSAIKPTKYRLESIDFIGVPSEIVYKTILYSRNNPKREKEFEIFRKLGVLPYKGDVFKLKFNNIDISWLPRLVNYVLECIGLIRLSMGKKYDIWK